LRADPRVKCPTLRPTLKIGTYKILLKFLKIKILQKSFQPFWNYVISNGHSVSTDEVASIGDMQVTYAPKKNKRLGHAKGTKAT
jgi:hypothetical protein